MGHSFPLKINLLLLSFKEISVVNANNVYPDQTPRPVASNLALHCLSMFLFGDARHKWVNVFWFSTV